MKNEINTAMTKSLQAKSISLSFLKHLTSTPIIGVHEPNIKIFFASGFS